MDRDDRVVGEICTVRAQPDLDRPADVERARCTGG
jgi:hypothetical protein